MNFLGRVFTIIGVSLTFIALILLWSVDILLGVSMSIFILLTFVWYLKTRRRGNSYLKRVAELMGCPFKRGWAAYGRVSGSYRGRIVVVEVKSGYDPSAGLTGLLASLATIDSSIGAVAGLRNFTIVRMKHQIPIDHPIRLFKGAYAVHGEAFYIPPCETSGLPKITPSQMVSKIGELSNALDALEPTRG